MLTLMLVVVTALVTGFDALRLPVNLLWHDGDEAPCQVWLTIHLLRVLLALVIGDPLALAGCVIRGLFHNPLADPGSLGISNGTVCAVAPWVMLSVSLPALLVLYAPMLAAFFGALATIVVVFIFSRQHDGSLLRLLPVDITINVFYGAAVGVLSWVSNDTQLHQLSLWGMGNLGAVQWSTLLAVASLTIPVVLITWRFAPALNLLQLGEKEAYYLSVDVRIIQRILPLCSTLLATSATVVSGVIDSTGLVIPHLIRMWLDSNYWTVIPGSVLADAFLLLIADTLAHAAVTPAETPAGLLTSSLGAPWFLWLIFRQRGPHG